MKKLTDAEKSEIIKNILGAANRKKQLGIEADLHCITKSDVKSILKAEGIDLRIFCGGRRDKKRIEDELIAEQTQEPTAQEPVNEPAPADVPAPAEQAESEEELAQQWVDLAIPPYEPLPPLSDEERVCEPIPYTKPEILDEPPKKGECEPVEDVIFIGVHIIEDEQLMAAVNKKLKELAAERQAHAARIEAIDNTLRKYAYFCTDCSNLIESEGIEV